jgi:PucR family transcriptional regulator, purine catabolism regulatory protein
MSELLGLDAVTEAVESGAGLPEVVRAAARALDASIAVADASGAVLAVAARSSGEERSLRAGGDGVATIALRVADETVGSLHMRARTEPSPLVRRLLLTIIASEVQRIKAPDTASALAAADFLRRALGTEPPPREELLALASALSLDLRAGVVLMVVRAHPQAPTEEGWRERARLAAERGARAAAGHCVAALSERDGTTGAEVVLVIGCAEDQPAERAGESVLRELHSALGGCTFALGRSRIATDPADLRRAFGEALLAANVVEASPHESVLAFEQTGAYRLLLSAMIDNPSELQRFYSETVEPLSAYDEQYETDLLQTLETFLEADANVAGAAQRLFTHRHTVYYRLERIRDLTGLDVSSSDGREKLSLGLKAMRVLGIPSARGPASEDGARAGRVPRRRPPRS